MYFPLLPTGLSELFPRLYEGYVDRGAWCEKGLGRGGLVLGTSHLTSIRFGNSSIMRARAESAQEHWAEDSISGDAALTQNACCRIAFTWYPSSSYSKRDYSVCT